MAFEIKKINFDGIELLPNITDTPLWVFFDVDSKANYKKSDRQLALLYQAIWQRENYFQLNTPTAFGNPDHSFSCGVVSGILQALGYDENIENEKIIIRREQDHKKILIIDKLTRPKSYYNSLKDNREVLNALGI